MALEDFLAPIFPHWAVRRMHAKLAYSQMRSYDAARTTRRTRGWTAPPTSANAEIEPQLNLLRNRSRDLVRNNPYAAAGLSVRVAYEVGCGIIPRSSTGEPALDTQADAVFAAWSAQADIASRHSFYGIQALLARGRAQDGEALALLVPLSRAEMTRRGQAVPLALQLLEPDYLDILKNEQLDDGGIIRRGVELAPDGTIRAYWLYEDHPGENFLLTRWNLISRRIPAAQVVHVFRQDRAGQVRGVPDLAPVMTRLRQLDEYEDAAIEQAKVQACFAAFVTSAAGAGRGPLEAPADSGAGEQRKTMAPGIIERLLPGENVEFATPSGGGGFSDFARHQLRAVATGLGLTYDLLTGDMTQANYSSLRAGRLAFKRQLEQAQEMILVRQVCLPVWNAVMDAARLAGELPNRAGPWPVEFAPPAFELLDPGAEATAWRDLARSGFASFGQVCAAMGWDPTKQLGEIARWNSQMDQLGIILDSDPRRTALAGTAQNPAANTKIELTAKPAA